MKKLILHPTDTSQWHALIREAQNQSNLYLNENTESYLVFLLMRYAQKASLFDSVLALDYICSLELVGKLHNERLKDIGDKSLLFCGLFPGMANIRHVSLGYFSDMGQAAYLSLSTKEARATANLFIELSEQFLMLQKVLKSVRGDILNNHYHSTFILSSGSDLMQ